MSQKPQPPAITADVSMPDEPYPCPHCGQMLAPAVRVCVSCKQSIDPGQIWRPEGPPDDAIPQPVPSTPAPALFSWRIFFGVLAGWFFIATAVQGLMGPKNSQLVMAGMVLASSAWVFFDAQAKGVPKALRWGLGSLLLWILVFPWYLARRRTPQAPCPFVEADASRLARALLFVLAVFFLLSAILFFLRGPLPR